MQTVAIVGVGLIGGSFGLALKKAGFSGRILGVSSAGALQEALERGAIDQASSLGEAVPQADLVYLSQTITRIIRTLGDIGPLLKPGALVTDAGSTKAAIVAEAQLRIPPGQFLGGHPMAGKEKRGALEADADLFSGRTYVLTPNKPDDLETPAAQELRRWIEAIGAVPKILGPLEHDRLVAYTSHLPQMLSTGLACTLAPRLGEDDQLRVSGPGLQDALRLAGSSYELWRDILKTNTAPVEAALEAYIKTLQSLRLHLRTERLKQDFDTANQLANRIKPGPG